MATFTHNNRKIPIAPDLAPNETDIYGVDWSRRLSEGETITGSIWEVPEGLQGGLEAASDTQTSVQISNGTFGERYLLKNRITTSEGKTLIRSMYIKCCPK